MLLMSYSGEENLRLSRKIDTASHWPTGFSKGARPPAYEESTRHLKLALLIICGSDEVAQ